MKKRERDDQVVTLIRDHADEAVVQFRRLMAKVESLEKRIGVLQVMIAEGAQMDFPWFHIKGDENGHKGKQVEKVISYLREHALASKLEAIEKTFVADPLGYDDIEGLKSYCYRNHIENYRNMG